jgi:hypothetical protein
LQVPKKQAEEALRRHFPHTSNPHQTTIYCVSGVSQPQPVVLARVIGGSSLYSFFRARKPPRGGMKMGKTFLILVEFPYSTAEKFPPKFFIIFVNLIIYKCGQSLSADFVLVLEFLYSNAEKFLRKFFIVYVNPIGFPYADKILRNFVLSANLLPQRLQRSSVTSASPSRAVSPFMRRFLQLGQSSHHSPPSAC